MLLYENGPWHVFRRLRQKLGVLYYGDSREIASSRYEITTCLWCLSVWVGAVVVLYFYLGGTSYLLMPFVLSALAVLVHRSIGK